MLCIKKCLICNVFVITITSIDQRKSSNYFQLFEMNKINIRIYSNLTFIIQETIIHYILFKKTKSYFKPFFRDTSYQKIKRSIYTYDDFRRSLIQKITELPSLFVVTHTYFLAGKRFKTVETRGTTIFVGNLGLVQSKN